MWTLAEVARATNAKNDVTKWQPIEFSSVSFDTRTLEPGALFVPLISDQDGHDFIHQAIQKGAIAAFWSHGLEEAPKDFPVIQVEDTKQALHDFAKYYLDKVNPIVIGITGSNGKTTTKDMTAAVVSVKYKTYKTQGNFNNDIGLPITILEMPQDTEAIVLEMGMNNPKEIHVLSTLAKPDIAVITMIGESHIEFFDSRKGIAKAKMEIVDGLKMNGILIYNGDEQLLANEVETFVNLKTKTFGTSTQNDMYPVFIESAVRETTFATNKNPKNALTIPIPGEYNVLNALAALSVGETLGISQEEAEESLNHFEMTKDRLEWLNGIKDTSLLNDAYNASPTSMKASVSYFTNIKVPQDKWLVLGEMGELGDFTEDMHLQIGSVIDLDKISQVVLYGEDMEVLYENLQKNHEDKKERIHFFKGDKAPLIEFLENTLNPRDYVLFKSSFGTDLLSVVEALKKGT